MDFAHTADYNEMKRKRKILGSCLRAEKSVEYGGDVEPTVVGEHRTVSKGLERAV